MNTKINMDDYTGAEFSQCRNYRYALWRIWDKGKPLLMCIGLNPSNAGENKNDPTIRRLISLVKKNGYGGFYMMNLFAWVTSKPKVLETALDPIGQNDDWLNEIRVKCHDVCFCWGAFKQAINRGNEIKERFKSPLCFGKNANGSPKHPLFLKGDTKLEDF